VRHKNVPPVSQLQLRFPTGGFLQTDFLSACYFNDGYNVVIQFLLHRFLTAEFTFGGAIARQKAGMRLLHRFLTAEFIFSGAIARRAGKRLL
jgi:hypothetical protein